MGIIKKKFILTYFFEHKHVMLVIPTFGGEGQRQWRFELEARLVY